MAYRKRRPTYTVCVENLPAHVYESDVIKKFASYGDIQSVFLKNGSTKTTKVAFIRFFSELDAIKAVSEVNGNMWCDNIINAKKCEKNAANFKKFEDRFSANRPKPVQNYPMYNFSPFSTLPDFMPNVFGNVFRSVAPRDIYFPYSDFNPKPPVTSFSTGRTANLQRLSSPEDRYMLCTYVEDAVTFYGQYAAKSNILGQITSYLQQICPSLPRLIKTPEHGRLYAAIYTGDGLWYRCKIQNNRGPGKTFVQYIDYGNSEELECFQLCELPESLRNQPCLAPKCVLVNLVPCEGSSSKQALFYLQETILGQHLVVTTCSSEDSPVYEVSKCICDSEDITRKLIEHKYVSLKTPTINGLMLNNSLHSQPVKSSNNSFANETKEFKNLFPYDKKIDVMKGEDKRPAIQSVMQSAVKSVVKPAVQPMVNPAVQAVVKPTAQLTVQPMVQTKVQPVVQPSLKPAVQPAVEPMIQSVVQRRPDSSCKSTSTIDLEHNSEEATKLKLEKDALEKEIDSLKTKCEKLEKNLEEKDLMLSKCGVFLKLESVARHLQHINSFRSNPLMDDSLVTDVFALLKKADSMLTEPQHELQKKIQDAFSSYHQSLKALASGQVKDPEKKNSCRELLCTYLNEYLDMYNDSMMKKLVEELNEALKKLEKLEKSPVDAWLTKEVSSMDELIKDYEMLKASKKILSEEVQQSADRAHKAFFDAFAKLQMTFCLFPAKATSNYSNHDASSPNANLELAFSSFDRAVSELEKALDSEISTVCAQIECEKETGVSVIECLIRLITDTLEQVEEESLVLQRYSSQLSNFSCFSSLQPMVAHVSDIREEISSIKFKLHHKLMDKKALEEIDNGDENAVLKIDEEIVELQQELHRAFVEEDYALKFFAKSFEASFTELEMEYPELGLTKYMNSDIIRQDWELEHFTCQLLPERLDTCYESIFADKLVILKEFLFESEEKSKHLEDKILAWNAIENPHLVEVLAMFGKNPKQMFVMMPRMYSLCEEITKPLLSSCKRHEVLIAVLNSLEMLHSHDIIHGMIHPSTVLLDKESVALDFMFETARRDRSDMEFKGICFQAPEISCGVGASKASDMYAFGCLVLSLLFSDVEFQTGAAGCPYLKNFRATIEMQVSSEDCTAIMSLVSPTIKNRPSAKLLLKCGFLKQMRYKEENNSGNSVHLANMPKSIILTNGVAKPVGLKAAESAEMTNHLEKKSCSTACTNGNSMLHQVCSLHQSLQFSQSLPESPPIAVTLDKVPDADSQHKGSPKPILKGSTIYQKLVSSHVESQDLMNIPTRANESFVLK